MKKKIGIITLHFADNFGAILQAFSLQTILQKLGYEPEFIKLKEFKEDINNYLKEKGAEYASNRDCCYCG